MLSNIGWSVITHPLCSCRALSVLITKSNRLRLHVSDCKSLPSPPPTEQLSYHPYASRGGRQMCQHFTSAGVRQNYASNYFLYSSPPALRTARGLLKAVRGVQRAKARGATPDEFASSWQGHVERQRQTTVHTPTHRLERLRTIWIS